MKLSQVKTLTPQERFVYWVKERESIRLKKEAGEPRPWTDDEILATYRFCNVRRMDDKVSRWLYDTWYAPHHDHPNTVPAVALARLVNNPSVLKDLTQWVFCDEDTRWHVIHNILQQARDRGSVFNAAYMVRGGKRGGDKIKGVVYEYVKPLADDPPKLDLESMRNSHAVIMSRFGFGSFMAGQVVADLRWAMEGTGRWCDRMTWAPLGPGSKKGMNRFHGRKPDAPLNQRQFERELHGLIEYCTLKLPSCIAGRLEAMDWQNCCCETDKLNRVLNGEGRPKQKYKPEK